MISTLRKSGRLGGKPHHQDGAQREVGRRGSPQAPCALARRSMAPRAPRRSAPWCRRRRALRLQGRHHVAEDGVGAVKSTDVPASGVERLERASATGTPSRPEPRQFRRRRPPARGDRPRRPAPCRPRRESPAPLPGPSCRPAPLTRLTRSSSHRLLKNRSRKKDGWLCRRKPTASHCPCLFLRTARGLSTLPCEGFCGKERPRLGPRGPTN